MTPRLSGTSPPRMVVAYLSGGFGLGFTAMVRFLVPLRASEVGVPLDLIGVIVGAEALVAVFLGIPLGALSDRIGARRTFILATSATAGLALLYVLASSFWSLLVLQLALGTASITGWFSAQNYVTGVGRIEDRAHDTGRFSFATHMSQIAAPLLMGAVAQAAGFRLAFLFLSAYAAAFAVVGLALPRLDRADGAGPRPDRFAGFREAAGLLRIGPIRVAMLLTSIRMWTLVVWVAFFPLLLIEAGMAPALAGTVVAGRAVVATLVALTAGPLARLASKQMVTAVGLAIGGLGLAVSPLATTLPSAFLPAALVGIGDGLSLALLLALVTDHAPEGQRGIAVGLRGTANQTAAALGPIAVAPLIATVGTSLGFLFGAAVAWAVVAAALAVHVRQQRRRAVPTSSL